MFVTSWWEVKNVKSCWTFLSICIFARVIMADLPSDLTDFLQNHPFLQVTDAKKVCSIFRNSHFYILEMHFSDRHVVVILCTVLWTFFVLRKWNIVDQVWCVCQSVCALSSFIGIFIPQIKCSLNGHEFPCNLTELKNFTSGKKYKKLSAVAEFDYSQYEPHVVPSTKEPWVNIAWLV